MEKLAIISAAHNEEKVIASTLINLTKISNKKDIYIISDGSIDKTDAIVQSFEVNFARTKKQSGKTNALEFGLIKFKILKKYDFVLFLDADTKLDKHFITHAMKRFTKEDVVCVCGMVQSQPKDNLFVSYRTLMYFVWQNLYKRISSIFNAVTIAPGTASVYRSSALKKIQFDEKIIIEDFDLTFQVHRKKLGKIVFEPKSKVITQDPDNLKDTFNQVARWQLGFLQTAKKHKVPFRFQTLDLAIAIFSIQNVIYTLFIVGVVVVTFWATFITYYPSIFGYYIYKNIFYSLIIFDIWIMMSFSVLCALFTRNSQPIKFGPILWLVQYVYIAAFFKAIYMATFKSIHGSWISPKRRFMK